MEIRYRIIFFFLGCSLTGAVNYSCVDLKADNAKRVDYSWKTDKTMCALLFKEEVVWQLNYNKTEDKPYFHPLKTPKGHNLTLERPKDHPWHRGLWFSWKYINQVNFWEEDPTKGLSDGRSVITAVDVKTNTDFSAEITMNISYQIEKKVVLTEIRTLQVSSPVGLDEYSINWLQTFKAESDLELDIEKPAVHGGKSWGGYAGLSFRAADSLVEHQFLSTNGWENSQSITGYGKNEAWMDLTAKVEGQEKEYVGLTIFDYPVNPRYPSPWYVWYEKGQHAFFTPSMLFNAPMKLKQDEGFELRYLVLVHDGQKSTEQLNEISKSVH